MKYISQFLSYLFHPLLAPTIGLFIIFNSGTYLSALIPEKKILLYILVFSTTFVFPAITLLFLLWQKLISSLNVDDKKERITPFLATLIFYYLGYYVFETNGITGLLKSFYLGALISLTLTFFINIFWKISAHMIGIGGITGLILAISFRLDVNLQFFLIIMIAFAGILGVARIKLEAHNPLQIIAGFYLGMASVFGVIMLY